ncbi:YceI family protein [Sediminitomix flava]|uniref:YceI-like domain-containing protein n=1 Tax=Sediminitomix flava TaxID=379075 RepID=A0A315ZJG6_SEDFL|nr:YceI family protein [Sediminitomix flava]PWJ44834.1 YceI-like domain-containing protein [Sediminitomix flava]
MRKNTLKVAFFAMLIGLAACGGEKKQAEKQEVVAVVPEAVEENVSYVYQQSETMVSWEAYKFTEKVGVGGVFDQFVVSMAKDSVAAPSEVLTSLSFSIPVESVNSNNPERDAKIKKYFFGTMASTSTIEGEVKSVEGSASKGIAQVALKLNNVEKTVPLNYTVEDATLKLEGVMDLGNWNAINSVKSLNDVCAELHRGTDGKSVLWPEVKLYVRSNFSKVKTDTQVETQIAK